MMWPVVILLAFAVVLLLIGIILRQRTTLRKTAGERDTSEAYQTLLSKSVAKNKNKQKIVDYLAKKGRANNAQLSQMLHVTPRTIVRYMDELEQEGKVIQIGDTGRGVFYHKS